MEKAVLIILIMIMGMAMPGIGVSAQDTVNSPMVVSDEGTYHLEVIAFNFGYTLVDLNKMNYLVKQGNDIDVAYNQSTMLSPIESLEKGRQIIVTAKSNDSTHGLYINELDIEFELKPPEEGEKYGLEKEKLTVLPSVDITIRAYCHIYCGEGHSEMQFELIVGEGSNFSGNQIEIFGDWRVWLLFVLFALAIIVIILLAKLNPSLQTRDGETYD